jgi:uncharacterized protein (TIGR03083 family)
VSTDWSPADPIAELRFALAEADAESPARAFRHRLLTGAMSQRSPGIPARPVDYVTGVETMRRSTTHLAGLLEALDDNEWARVTVRHLDVQGLVGHLIGVEHAFASTLHGDVSAADADHVASTQPSVQRQLGRPPAQTLQEWTSAINQTLALVQDERDPARPVRFHGFELALDAFLVVRSFELWTHEEDIRKSTGRELSDPDPETLNRMTDLATTLLPAGITRVGGSEAGMSARLVLTGPGGGAWDVPMQDRRVARAAPGSRCDAHIVVDAASFCRVVANRADLESSGALVTNDIGLARTIFAGAAALALD